MDVDAAEHPARRVVKDERESDADAEHASPDEAPQDTGDEADEAEASDETKPHAGDDDDNDMPLEGSDEGVTRCVCGNSDENVGLMIQCESCKCWQHCVCMGMHTEDDCPDVYYCEQCRPENHIALLRALGTLPPPKAAKRGRHGRAGTPKESARELREAKEAVRAIAAANAARLRSEGGGQRAPQSPRRPAERMPSRRRTARDSGDEAPPASADDDDKKRKRAADAAALSDEPEQPGPAELAKRRRMGEGTRNGSEPPAVPEAAPAPTPAAAGSAGPTGRRDPRRHPNQYTYRREAPKRDRRRDVDTHETHDSGRAVLPEHLTHLAYLVPATVGADDDGSEEARPTDPALPEQFALRVPLDPATKIRYPARRMTLGEMRKRVRAIGEYVTRVQIDAVERERRARSLGIGTARGVDDLPLSMQLVDQLTRDLNQFQRRFGGAAARDD